VYFYRIGMKEADGNVYIVARVLTTSKGLLGYKVDKLNLYAYNPSGDSDGVFEGEALPIYDKYGKDPPGYLPMYKKV
jgi:hypothetical protein